MPMKIEVCGGCGRPTGKLFAPLCRCDCTKAETITIPTDRELNHAKIEAYQDVLDACNKTESLDCIKDFIEEKIYSVEKKMEG